MALKYDPEYYKAIEPLIPMMASQPKPPPNDVETRRKVFEPSLALMANTLPDSPLVEQTEHTIDTPAGHKLSVYSFIKKGGAPSQAPGPAVLHCHGGGMILGSVAMMAKPVASLVDKTSIPMFSVEYRLAPGAQDSALVEDCYAGLVWLMENASKFNVDPKRIAVMGESAGGGLAAGVALMARDKKLSPPLAKQILIYPMLDDRNLVTNEVLAPFAVWNYADNITGWTALLGDKAGNPDADVSIYAVPARAKSLAGLPPTYIDVGGLDIFRDEDLAYASRIAAEDIEVEFHLYPGLPHGFEIFCPQTNVTKNVLENRFKALMSF